MPETTQAQAAKAVEVRPIGEEDLGRVAEFLRAVHDDPDLTLADWHRILAVPWPGEQPNRGYMACAGEEILGAYVAYYSEQEVGGRRERFCNLGAWVVREGHRLLSLRLVRELLDQEGCTFTDVTPIQEVAALDERLGFESLDVRSAISLGLPIPLPAWRGRIAFEPEEIERCLRGHDLEVYRDHAGAPGIDHVAIERGGQSAYVAYRREHRKGIPLIHYLHVGDPDLFWRLRRRLTSRLLARHRAFATIYEQGVTRGRPRLSLWLRTPTPRLFRGERVGRDDVSLLYTELACLPQR